MNAVQRFEAVMNFKTPDSFPVIEWAPYWDQTLRRWYAEGLPDNLVDSVDIRDFFGFDRYLQLWFSPRKESAPQPEYHGATRLKEPANYAQFKEKYLFPWPAFDTSVMQSWAREQKKGSTVVWITLEGFFWFPRTLLGIEGHLYAFYDNSDVMHAMNNDLVEYHLKVLEKLCKILRPNFMVFAEDMSYNHGPMLSKSLFDEFLAPYYRRVIPVLKEYGIIPFVDSDGDVHPLIPWLKEVGIEGILPLERMAGVDVARIRKEHQRFKMIGAFDKTVMSKGEKAVINEFERLLPVMKSGGFIPSVDHQTPPDVSLEQYRCYIRLLKEYCSKVPT